jgi:DNA processing protein
LVGARAATGYGTQLAQAWAGLLAERDVTVVSGGAFGIDAAAHRGALAAQAPTVVVSAGGLDNPYPPGNARLYEAAADTGLCVSESPPGCAPRRRRFLSRNRLIAALSTGTVVVEAARRSGALNTAHHGHVLGRPVMAVPGPVTSAASAGCHWLLARDEPRTYLVTSPNDVLELVGASRDVLSERDITRRDGFGLRDRLDALDATSRQVFDGFPARGWIDPDRLAAALTVDLPSVLRALPLLELAGLIETGPRGYRIRPSAHGRSRRSETG